MNYAPCPNCGGRSLFRSKPVSAGGGHAPNYLPGIRRGLLSERFQLVLCGDCGLTRFFASRQASEKVAASDRWERV